MAKSRFSIEVKVPQRCWQGSLYYLLGGKSKLKSKINQSKPNINPNIIYIEAGEGGRVRVGKGKDKKESRDES